MVKVPPYWSVSKLVIEACHWKRTWYSPGASLPSRAFFAKPFASAEMEAKPLEPASLMMGVINPVGVATATEMSAFL